MKPYDKELNEQFVFNVISCLVATVTCAALWGLVGWQSAVCCAFFLVLMFLGGIMCHLHVLMTQKYSEKEEESHGK